MHAHARKFKELVLLAATLAGIATWSSATTTQESSSFGANLGSLSYQLTTQSATCTSDYGNDVYTIYTWNNFKYVAINGTSQPINDETYWDVGIGGRLIGSGNCPDDPSGGIITYVGTGYTIIITPHNNGTLSATILVAGYINPRYIVVGMIYAPPGHLSYVNYANTNLVSSTITTKTTFASGYTEGSATMTSNQVQPFKGGMIDSTTKSSSSYTQTTTTTDSTAVTVQKTSSTLLQVPGPVCDYCGVDHDYDLIQVWLNPVQLFTLTNNGVVQPNGYGFSTYDQPGMDVYNVYAGELNGDLPVRSSTTAALARSWASVFTWPSGQGPGLTSQDEQNILKMDPYWNCTYKSAVTDTTDCAEPPSSARFTESTNSNFPYAQPAAGGNPTTKAYMWSYTTTDTQGIDVTESFAQTFGLEKVFGASLFGLGYQKTLSQSSTTTETYETSSQFTSSNTTTANASITGPPCTVVSGNCSPMYPPPNAFNPITCAALSLATSFGQGDSMYLYQDNLFGTFLIEPYGQ